MKRREGTNKTDLFLLGSHYSSSGRLFHCLCSQSRRRRPLLLLEFKSRRPRGDTKVHKSFANVSSTYQTRVRLVQEDKEEQKWSQGRNKE